MAKLPSFQFYPGDWMKDPELRSVSSGAKGLWIDMLCLMFESSCRGYLQTPSGKPFTTERLCKMTGNLSVEEVDRWLEELEDATVFSRNKQGVIFSRRQVRDERKRQASQENGKKGGRPPNNPAVNPSETQEVTQRKPKTKPNRNLNKTPSSSASSSASAAPQPPTGGDGKAAGGIDRSCEQILSRAGMRQRAGGVAELLNDDPWLAVRLWKHVSDRTPAPTSPPGLMAKIAKDGDFENLPPIKPSLLLAAINSRIVETVNCLPGDELVHCGRDGSEGPGFYHDGRLLLANDKVAEAVLA